MLRIQRSSMVLCSGWVLATVSMGQDAVAPLTVDSVAHQAAYLKASNTEEYDSFGHCVAMSGDTIVVGAYREAGNGNNVNGIPTDNSAPGAGAAYVFVRTGTTWRLQAYLKASNSDTFDWFGISVAISGDTVVVGASGEDSPANGVDGDQLNNAGTGIGAAYVFVRDGTDWRQQAYLKASNSGNYDRFGGSVAVSGDTVVVGAPGEGSNATGVNGNQIDNSAGSAGAAYVFVRNRTNWTQQAYLKASNTEGGSLPGDTGDEFGTSVSVSGDTLVVGAVNEESSATGVDGAQHDNGAVKAGAAYVFVRSGTAWTQQAYLKASNTEAFDSFGESVAVSHDTVVVGASNEDSSATGIDGDQGDDESEFAGAAYVFVRNRGTWSQQVYLKASNTGQNDSFGNAVGILGNTIVIGAPGEASNSTGVGGDQHNNYASSSGAAYVFVRHGTDWNQWAYLKASNTGAGDWFGCSAAVTGDDIVVGAVREASISTGVDGEQLNDSAVLAGAAYVFVVDPPWSDLGNGLAGIAGVPSLTGIGTLLPGSAGSLTLAHAAASAFAVLVSSTVGDPTPFHCGTLLPALPATILGFGTDGDGEHVAPWTNWPGGLSGQSLYLQCAIADAAADCGVSLSNALRADVP